MDTQTTTTKRPKRSIRLLSPWKIKVLKNRVKRLGMTYWQIGDQCRPPVTDKMVEKVLNGWGKSSNVMGTIKRLEAEKAAQEADGAPDNGKGRADAR